jgi:hypothetical protein
MVLSHERMGVWLFSRTGHMGWLADRDENFVYYCITVYLPSNDHEHTIQR